MHHLSLVWLRRNLRLEDNKVLASAVNNSHKIQPIFIFDASILEQPNASNTRRLSFLMDALIGLNHRLNKKDGKILVFYGDAKVIIPKVVRFLKIDAVYADEEFEPAKIKRDKLIHEQLQGDCEFKLICDHLLFHPAHILNKEGKPFKIFTPYMKAFRARLSDEVICKFNYKFENKLLLDNEVASNEYYQVVDITLGSKLALEQIGHNYQKNLLWPVDEGKKRLENFIYKKLHKYEYARNFLAQDGTSSLSPYLRFGLISIRECYRLALEEENAQKWLSELIWKEFYATILYHFPYTQNLEFQVKFQGTLPWNSDPELLAKFCTGQTGFPIIDAAVRQLLLEGWMHNRARLIVVSFFTKNLFLNWRLGEKFFAQHLIDYDLASNVGGWQWASSCGTDPQPFFRIFNPITQGLKFDPDAKYIKEYVQELKSVPVKLLHNQKAVANNFAGKYNYSSPIIDYQESRANSLAIFRSAKSAPLITQIV